MTSSTLTRTIRKNSSEFSAAVSGATNIRVFSLDNSFAGVPETEFPKWIGDDFKLVKCGETYKARVHSNLWLEFEALA